MRRREFITLLSGAVAWPLATHGQQAGKVIRIGFIGMATLRSGAGVPVGLRATGNPRGPRHQWVRQRYIDPAPAGRIHFSSLRDAGANSISKATRNSPRARAVARNRSPLFLMHFSEDAVMYGS
jgi:hypothetical protein